MASNITNKQKRQELTEFFLSPNNRFNGLGLVFDLEDFEWASTASTIAMALAGADIDDEYSAVGFFCTLLGEDAVPLGDRGEEGDEDRPL